MKISVFHNLHFIKGKNRLFWHDFFWVKSHNLYQFCIICENFSFPPFTVKKGQKSLILSRWEVVWLYFSKNYASSPYSAQFVKISAFHHLRFREGKNCLFWAGEGLRDYILWKITQPLPILHNIWKFQLSIIYGLERAKITYFELVRGCVTLFCEKSGNLSLFCTICENFNFPSFTV